MKFMRQSLTPEQYRRSNKAMLFILMICYVIFVTIEVNNLSKTGYADASAFVRCGIYVAAMVVTGLLVKLFETRKLAMVCMAVLFAATYAVLVFANGAGSLVMAFPAIIGFMVYLNAPLVFAGCAVALVLSIVKTAMLKAGGDMVGYGFANVTTMGMIISILGSWRAISLLIQFSKEDQEVISKEAEHRAEVAKTVADITEKVNADFNIVLAELSTINEAMGAAHSSMEEITRSSESTADAIGRQADMTGQIQTRLERANDTATRAKEVSGKLKDVIVTGKQNADELHEQSVLVDENTAHISETVDLLVENVQKVSSITEAILNISSQTNMLALNASIEAARAGELGKGFAVVADQIRNLAEQTKVSTEQITEIVAELNAVTKETQEGLQLSVDSINAQRQKVNEVTANFTEVETGMLELESGVDSMGHEVRRVLVANKQIVDSIATLSASSEEVLAGTQVSKETIDSTFDGLNGFSKTVEMTFEQLQNLKEATAMDTTEE